LSRHARAERRSLSAEVITLLTRALESAERSPEQILAAIEERRRFTPAAVGAPDSTTLLRQDRDR
jgi:plasmid stability protein